MDKIELLAKDIKPEFVEKMDNLFQLNCQINRLQLEAQNIRLKITADLAITFDEFQQLWRELNVERKPNES